MCLPAAYAAYAMYAAMAVSTAQAVIQHQDQKASADAQEKMIRDGYALEQQQALRQYSEQQQVAQEDLGKRYSEGLVEEARLKAIGAESGLQGVTNDRIVDEANNATDRDLSMIEANRVRANEQIHSQIGAKQNQANVQAAGIRRPSAAGTGLQIAGNAFRIYSDYNKPSGTPAGKS